MLDARVAPEEVRVDDPLTIRAVLRVEGDVDRRVVYALDAVSMRAVPLGASLTAPTTPDAWTWGVEHVLRLQQVPAIARSATITAATPLPLDSVVARTRLAPGSYAIQVCARVEDAAFAAGHGPPSALEVCAPRARLQVRAR